jgi:hypothetical protein
VSFLFKQAVGYIQHCQGFVDWKDCFCLFVDGLKKIMADFAAFDRRMEAKIPKM